MLREFFSGNIDFSDAIIYVVSCLVVIFLTLPIHEFAHGWTAVKLGDNTPRWQGRMTLNPFAHIDYVGALCIFLLGFGWAKPVQVNQLNFKNPKRDMAITALAGPVSNLIVALVAAVLYNAVVIFGLARSQSEVLFAVMLFFMYIIQINVALAVFNLIPIPPLDGSRILSAFLPNRYYYKLMQYEQILFWVVIVLLWTGALGGPLSYLTSVVSRGIQYLAYLPFRLILG